MSAGMAPGIFQDYNVEADNSSCRFGVITTLSRPATQATIRISGLDKVHYNITTLLAQSESEDSRGGERAA